MPLVALRLYQYSDKSVVITYVGMHTEFLLQSRNYSKKLFIIFVYDASQVIGKLSLTWQTRQS